MFTIDAHRRLQLTFAPRIVAAAVLLLTIAADKDVHSQALGSEPLESLDEVVVIGRVPGPPLWKVSNGDHTLWILPLVDMYPRKIQWESARVETLIRESQEFIHSPGVSYGIHTSSPLLLLRLRRIFNGMMELPGKKTLADVLPADMHMRFNLIKSRYFPADRRIDRLTVGAAPGAIQTEILEHENLSASATPVTMRIEKWLKSNKRIRRTQTRVATSHKVSAKEVSALADAIKEVSATPAYIESQIGCFDRILTYFEEGLEPAKRRANAWAQGYIQGLIDPAPLYGPRIACTDPFSDIDRFPAMKQLITAHPGLASPDIDAMTKDSHQRWLDAAESALSRNVSTFSMLPIDDVLSEGGLVAQLKAKGYRVDISAEPPERL